jgi:8-oxo-dGTP diphosphatase
MDLHTLVGYALCMLIKDDAVLMLKRSSKSSFEPGSFSLPGGKVEKHESFKQACKRELTEELGITAREDDLEFVHAFYRNGMDHELIAIVFTCVKWEGIPTNKEPIKHEQLEWIAYDELANYLVVPAHKKVWGAILAGGKYSEFL